MKNKLIEAKAEALVSLRLTDNQSRTTLHHFVGALKNVELTKDQEKMIAAQLEKAILFSIFGNNTHQI